MCAGLRVNITRTCAVNPELRPKGLDKQYAAALPSGSCFFMKREFHLDSVIVVEKLGGQVDLELCISPVTV